MAGRAVKWGSVLAAGGIGYYLYTAGGDPKLAQKQAEADASKISADVKANLPGRDKELEKDAQKLGQDAKSSISSYASEAQKKANEFTSDAQKKANSLYADAQKQGNAASADLEKYRKDAANEINKGIDKFDQKVTEGAAEAKKGISSWFGGK